MSATTSLSGGAEVCPKCADRRNAAEARLMSATVQRLRAPSGNRDNDYHRPVCPSCNWKGPLYSNRTVEGLRLAERAAAQHQCDGTPTCAAHATQLDSEDVQ